MKPSALLFICCIIAFSCKKADRVCNCTVTTIGTTYTTTSSILLPVDTTIVTPLYTTNINKIKLEKVTKKKAQYNCINRSEDIDETTSNNIPGFLSITNRNTGTRTYRCKLE